MAKVERMHVTVFTILLLVGVSVAVAADLPKQGNYDFTSCWSGVSNTIAFSKTHTASSYELTGTTRSNPPGGPFDMLTVRCVGISSSLEGRNTGGNICEAIDKDGDKYLARNTNEGPKQV